jgi:hypothetical protein
MPTNPIPLEPPPDTVAKGSQSDDQAEVIVKVEEKRVEDNKHSRTVKQQSTAVLKEPVSGWERVIPWFLTIACTVSLISIALFLILNVEWFKADVFRQATVTNSYKIYIYHMHLSMIKRSVGLFSGFAMMFVGASVCFYVVKAKTDVGFKAQNFSLSLITTSPGIIAMILGASLIMFTIWSKDDFPSPDTDNLPALIQPQPEPTTEKGQ